MVNLAYIRKRKARRIIVAVALGCAATALVIGAIAMLGQKASPFTVKLSNAGANLSLSTKGDEATNEGRVYIMADDIPEYCVYSEKLLNTKQNIDSEYTDSEFSYDDQNKEIATRFFKLTFFVENKGDTPADYDLRLTMSNPTNLAANRFDIDSILRVRFYENKMFEDESLNEHNEPVTYAKRSATPHEVGSEIVWKEYISDETSGFAEEFLSSKLILKSHVANLKKGEKIRNTFVLWLEGNDPECVGEEVPENGGLILGVDISAHEANPTD